MLNIPNQLAPGWAPIAQGFKLGTDFYNNIVEQQTKRAAMKHAEAQMKRAEELQPLHKLMLQAQIAHQNALSKKASQDPMAQIKAMMEYANTFNAENGNNSNNAQPDMLGNPEEEQNKQQQQSYIPSVPNEPNMEGMPFSPYDLAEERPKLNENGYNPYNEHIKQQQNFNQEPNKNNFLESAKTNPFIAGMVKKVTGINPYEGNKNKNGTTREERDRNFRFKQEQFNRQKQHLDYIEQNGTNEAKIDAAEKKSQIKVEEQKLINDHKADLEYIKKLNTKEAEQFADMEKDATEQLKGQETLQELGNLIKTPEFESARKYPYLGHVEFEYNKKHASKKVQHVLNQIETYSTKLIADTAKGLNSRFTNKDLELAKSMKISDKDSLEGARAKVMALMQINKMGIQRLDKTMSLINKSIKSGRRMSPYDAFKEAGEYVNAALIRKSIEESFKKKVKGIESQKTKPSNNQTKSNMIKIDNGIDEGQPGYQFKWVTKEEAERMGAK